MHWFDPLLETIAKEFEEHWRERRWGAVIVYILFGLLFLAGSIWLAHLRGWL